MQQLDNILSSTGEVLLNGPGSVSHQQAMEKVEQEYRLFQVRELSPVERAYLETIKTINAKAKGKGSEKE
nr:virulence RhuM family protein [Bacteroides sp.]